MAREVDQASAADCLLQADCCRRMPLRMAAIDDKAELQEFDQTALKPTSTIRDVRAKQLGCLIVPICH